MRKSQIEVTELKKIKTELKHKSIPAQNPRKMGGHKWKGQLCGGQETQSFRQSFIASEVTSP